MKMAGWLKERGRKRWKRGMGKEEKKDQRGR